MISHPSDLEILTAPSSFCFEIPEGHWDYPSCIWRPAASAPFYVSSNSATKIYAVDPWSHTGFGPNLANFYLIRDRCSPFDFSCPTWNFDCYFFHFHSQIPGPIDFWNSSNWLARASDYSEIGGRDPSYHSDPNWYWCLPRSVDSWPSSHLVNFDSNSNCRIDFLLFHDLWAQTTPSPSNANFQWNVHISRRSWNWHFGSPRYSSVASAPGAWYPAGWFLKGFQRPQLMSVILLNFDWFSIGRPSCSSDLKTFDSVDISICKSCCSSSHRNLKLNSSSSGFVTAISEFCHMAQPWDRFLPAHDISSSPRWESPWVMVNISAQPSKADHRRPSIFLWTNLCLDSRNLWRPYHAKICQFSILIVSHWASPWRSTYWFDSSFWTSRMPDLSYNCWPYRDSWNFPSSYSAHLSWIYPYNWLLSDFFISNSVRWKRLSDQNYW